MSRISAEMALLGGTDRTSPLLEEIDWSQPLGSTLGTIRDVFETASPDGLKRAIAQRRHNVSAEDARTLEAASAERPLTLKHCVALGSVANPTKLWVHQYRPEAWSENAGGRYIERFHNHRGGIVSYILSGGYTADEFRYPVIPEEPMASKDFDVWGPARQGLLSKEVTYREGDVMWLHPDEMHRLRDIQPGTVTLMAETPRTRDYSFVFDSEGQYPVVMYPDMGGHYDSLSSQFSQA